MILHVNNVTKNFGGVTAIKETSFSVDRKEIFGLIGSNGAGKTTFIKMLLGLYPIDGGELRLLGKTIQTPQDRQALKASIGYVSQHFALYNDMSVQENLLYFANDNDGDKDSIFTTGLLLGYKTASFYGLSANFTFQGSASPFADSGAKGDYSGDMYGSGAQLSEAYLAYSVGKTTALIGRMFLDTPLVATSSSRVVKDSFEGAALINTDLPNTTLIAGYVQKYQNRTDGEGNIGKFSKFMGTGSGHPSSDLNDVFDALGVVDGDSSLYVKNGAFTLAAINKSIAGLTLTAAYAQAMDVKNFDAALTIDNVRIAYGEAAYAGAAGNFTYGLAAQYYFNSYSGVNGLAV